MKKPSNITEVYVALSEAIANGDVETGRQIVEAWIPVASADPAFVSLAKVIKSMYKKKSSTNITTSGDSVNQKEDPLSELRTAYLNDRTNILKKITGLLDVNDFDAAFELLERYKPVANEDTEYNSILKLASEKKNAKRSEAYLKALDVLPEDDCPIRLDILNRIVQLVPSEENKQILDRCLESYLKNAKIVLPSTDEISDMNKAMLNLQSENNCIVRSILCNRILRFYSSYKLERIRCDRAGEQIIMLKNKLNEIPEDDNEQRIEVYKQMIKIDNNFDYKIKIAEHTRILQRQKDKQRQELLDKYLAEKDQIINMLSSALARKLYTDAASILEEYYPVAKKDVNFMICIHQAQYAAIALQQANIRNELIALPADDYEGRKELCKKALKYDPYDDYFIRQYNLSERALNIQNNSFQSDAQTDTPMDTPEAIIDIDNEGKALVPDEPITLETLPAVVQNSNTSLKEISDQETINRIVEVLNAGAQFCTKSSEIAKKLGDFMLNNSNSPLIQLTSNAIPQVSPVMNTIGKVSNMVAEGLEVGAQGLSELAQNAEEIGQAIVLIVRAGSNLAQSCKNLGADIVNSEGFKRFIELTSSITSLVIGNHYMKQIGVELKGIENTVSKIMSFLEAEYQGKLKRLCDDVRDLNKFNAEILVNEENRKRKTDKLEKMQDECSDLFNQKYLYLGDIKKITAKDLNFEEYEECVYDMEMTVKYLNVLTNILYEICRLKFTLNLGRVSWEQCYERFLQYEKELNDVSAHIQTFHSDAIKVFSIDLDKSLRKNPETGFFSIFSNEFLPISQDTVDIIKRQMSTPVRKQLDMVDLFQQDMRIIFKNNKLYYVANEHNELLGDMDINWVIQTLKDA